VSWTVGVIGCGRMGGRHIRAFSQHPSFSLVAAVDPEPERRDRLQRECKIPRGFLTLEELLSSAAVDVYALCTPTDLHFPQARRILTGSRMPRFLFIEKPVCLRPTELSQIQRMARKAGVTVAVNHTRRFDPPHRRLAEWIRSGRPGGLLQGRCVYYGGWLNNGTHWVDLLRMLFPEEPRIVSARSAGFGRGPDLNLHAELRVGEAPVVLEPVEESHYQLFEGEFRFQRGRVRLSDFGKRIELEEVQTNARGERILQPVQESPWSGMISSLPAAVEAVASALAGEDSLRRLGADLTDTARTMELVWSAQAMAGLTETMP